VNRLSIDPVRTIGSTSVRNFPKLQSLFHPQLTKLSTTGCLIYTLLLCKILSVRWILTLSRFHSRLSFEP
jgi:hypothetical protein